MDICMGLVVTVLKAAVSGAIKNEIIAALAEKGIETGSEKLEEYLKKVQKELDTILSDKNLTEKIHVPNDKTGYVREEIKELLQSVEIDEKLFRECNYNAESLSNALYQKYREQKKYVDENEGEIQKIISEISKKAISLEKDRDGFVADSLVNIMTDVKEIKAAVKEKEETIETERGEISKRRLPDRTEEYQRKWNENMFLNDFDQDDENAGVNIPLWKLHKVPYYRLKGQERDLKNLEERLEKCTRGDDPKNRMLLILGQPGMGKSTMITWFLNQYQKKDWDHKEILVYRFTDLPDIAWNGINRTRRSDENDIASDILECLHMEKEDLNGKILILDGFDEISVGNNRTSILNCLYNAWARDAHIKDFALLVTCRENYVEDLSRLSFPYITLQSWNEEQIEDFCKEYAKLSKTQIPQETIDKMKEMQEVFGIPIILYMALALGITVGNESSVVEVYDQIFSLEGGLYDRCLKRDASVRWDDRHRITEIKEQIHQFSKEISMWMFENNPEQAMITKREYEKIQNQIFVKDSGVDESKKMDVLIGNYFRLVPYYDGADTEQLTFVHRSIYEYFVAETISSEVKEAAFELTEETQERLAGVLGERLKSGKISYSIGQYLKAKINWRNREKEEQFYTLLEGAAGKMIDAGMLYYTGRNIKEFRNIIAKEMNCFRNLLNLLRSFLNLSGNKYILQNVEQQNLEVYIKQLNVFEQEDSFINGANLERVDLGKADLVGANLTGADLSRANLMGADLGKADLREAYLIRADLRGANLREANLREADLDSADLGGADLREADLREADLGGADLMGADLREANLMGANLEESIFLKEEVDKYIDYIKQCSFDVIRIYSDSSDEKILVSRLTREELLARYPD